MKLYRMATIEPGTNMITHVSVWASPHNAPLNLVEVMPWQGVGHHINSSNPDIDSEEEEQEEEEELNP